MDISWCLSMWFVTHTGLRQEHPEATRAIMDTWRAYLSDCHPLSQLTELWRCRLMSSVTTTYRPVTDHTVQCGRNGATLGSSTTMWYDNMWHKPGPPAWLSTGPPTFWLWRYWKTNNEPMPGNLTYIQPFPVYTWRHVNHAPYTRR